MWCWKFCSGWSDFADFYHKNERLIKVGFHFRKNRIFSMRVTNWNYITDKADITMQSDITMHSKKCFSNVVASSHSSCVFLYLFSSAKISPVRFVLHLQDWRCVGNWETSFPVNKLWLIYLSPSLWPLSMKTMHLLFKYKTNQCLRVTSLSWVDFIWR